MQLLSTIRDSVTRTESADPAATGIPPTTMYEVLRNERRRRIVEFLASMDSNQVTIADIADHLAGEYPGEERQRAYIAIYQNHLPAMEKEGLIKIDRDCVVPKPALIDVWRAHLRVEEELS